MPTVPSRAGDSSEPLRSVIRSLLDGEMRAQRLKIFVLMTTLACLSACSWFGSRNSWFGPRKQELPDPTEIIVTGAPESSLIFVDGVQTGPETAVSDHPQVLNVAAGAHKVEIHVGDKIVYREDTYVGAGERRVVTVLSGLTR
jgi:hypothetical protein